MVFAKELNILKKKIILLHTFRLMYSFHYQVTQNMIELVMIFITPSRGDILLENVTKFGNDFYRLIY